jgi:hypothetical protein
MSTTRLESLNIKSWCNQVEFCHVIGSLTICHLPLAICDWRSAIGSEAALLAEVCGRANQSKGLLARRAEDKMPV